MAFVNLPEADEVEVRVIVNLLEWREEATAPERVLAISRNLKRRKAQDPNLYRIAKDRFTAGAPKRREAQVREVVERKTREKQESAGVAHKAASAARTVRDHPLEAAQKTLELAGELNEKVDAMGGYDLLKSVAHVGDTGPVPVGTMAEVGVGLAKIPGNVVGAVRADKKAKKIQAVVDAEEARQAAAGTGGGSPEDRSRQASAQMMSAARSAVYKERGNPERLQWASGGDRANESSVTGQHQMLVDEPPPLEPSEQHLADAAVGTGRRTAQEERKLRKKKIVDAVTAPIPKATATLEFIRACRDDGWKSLRNQDERKDLAASLLHLAIRDSNPTAMEVFRELVRSQDERGELRDLYIVPATSNKAVEKLAKKLNR